MSAKNDINLFKAAGGGKIKVKKRPITFYLTWVLVFVFIACAGIIAYFVYATGQQETTLNDLKLLFGRYEATSNRTKDKAEEYKQVINNIDQAEMIEQILAKTNNRYPDASDEEIAALLEVLQNTTPLGLSYSYTVNQVDPETGDYELYDFYEIQDAIPMDIGDGNGKNMYSTWTYVLDEFIKVQEESDIPVWYVYYRGQMAIIFEGGGANGDGLNALCGSLYAGWSYSDSNYAPFSQLCVDGDVPYNDGKYAYLTVGERNYNLILLSMKSVEERLFDILDERATYLQTNWGTEYPTDHFNYDVLNLAFNGKQLEFDLKLFNTSDKSKFAIDYVDYPGWTSAIFDSYCFNPPDDMQGYTNTDVGEYRIYHIILDIEGALTITEGGM